MINWMRNAFLKLSPTYQLRTSVEQWYDADGTEEHVTNPIEIVRSVLCIESNMRRHSSELIRDAIGSRDALAPFRSMSSLMCGFAQPEGFFDRSTIGITKTDMLVPEMALHSDGRLVVTRDEVLVRCGSLTARRYRPQRSIVEGKGINKPIEGTALFLDEAVATLSRCTVPDVYNLATFMAGMQFFVLENSYVYAHCAFRPVGAFALRAISEPLMPLMFRLVKAAPISSIIYPREDCFMRMRADEVLVSLSMNTVEVADAIRLMVAMRAPELREVLLLDEDEFEDLCSRYEDRYQLDVAPLDTDMDLRIRVISLNELRERCDFLCDHLKVEQRYETRGPAGQTGHPVVTRKSRTVLQKSRDDSNGVTMYGQPVAYQGGSLDMTDVMVAHLLLQSACASTSHASVISQEAGSSSNVYVEDSAPTTTRESAPCYAPDPTPAPQPYSAPDTYSPPSSCDSGGGSNNDY